MTEQEARSHLMDYLYDELEPSVKKDFEAYLNEHPELLAELQELKGTHTLLQKTPTVEPSRKLVLMIPEREEHPIAEPRRMVRYLRAAVAIAAVFLVMILSFSWVDLQISQSNQGFLISFGNATPLAVDTNEGVSQEEVYNLIAQIQQENSQVLAAVIEESQEQQRRQLEETVATLTEYYDRRRQQDLLLISEGLAQLEEETYYRFLQTDETLGDLIYALSYQQPLNEQP